MESYPRMHVREQALLYVQSFIPCLKTWAYLLDILLKAAWKAGVKHCLYILLVHTHTKGYCSDNNTDTSCHERSL
jgi:hypothetical protein